METTIRLYECDQGELVYLQNEFGIEQLGGIIPVVGDLIVEPGVSIGLDREAPENRDIYEVVSRYFLPSTKPDFNYIAVVVKQRTARQSEADIVRLI